MRGVQIANSSQLCECDAFARERSLRHPPVVFRGSCSGRASIPQQLRRQRPSGRQAMSTDRQASASFQNDDDGRWSGQQSASQWTREDVQGLAAIMPDPQEDELVDMGSGSSGLHLPNSFSDTRQMMAQHGLPQGALVSSSYMQDTWNDMGDQDAGGSDWSGGQLAPGRGASSAPDSGSSLQAEDEEFNRDMAQAKFEYKARKYWELGVAQAKAMELHHKQMERARNRYSVAIRLGEIMEELETKDHFAGDEENPIPSWIRAHFVLEHEFEELNENQRKLEAAIDRADNQQMEDMAMEALDAAMDSFYSRAAVGEGAGSGEGAGTGDPLDDFLGDLIPGGSADSVDAYLDDIMGPDAAADPEGLGLSAGEAASAAEDDDFLDIAGLDIDAE